MSKKSKITSITPEISDGEIVTKPQTPVENAVKNTVTQATQAQQAATDALAAAHQNQIETMTKALLAKHTEIGSMAFELVKFNIPDLGSQTPDTLQPFIAKCYEVAEAFKAEVDRRWENAVGQMTRTVTSTAPTSVHSSSPTSVN